MQKKLIALAIAGLSGAAFAQSNVTVYGVADASFESVSATGATANGGNNEVTQSTRSRITSNSSYFGLKGTESLGGGMSALYQIETQFALDNSNNATAGARQDTLANRDSFVGLTGNFGTAIMGYLSTPYRALGAKFDVMPGATGVAGFNGMIGHMNLGASKTAAGTTANVFTAASSNLNTVGRTQAVAYVSPTVNGFNATLAYVPNEGKGTSTNNSNAYVQNASAWNLALNYDNGGPLKAGYSYLTNKDALGGSAYTVFNAGTNLTSSKLITHLFAIGYTFGGATTVNFMYNANEAKADYSVAVNSGNNVKNKVYGLGVKHVMGAHEIAGVYYRVTDGSVGNAGTGTENATDRGASQFGLRYAYNMSKRTQLYGLWTKISNKANGNYDFGAGTAVGGAVTAGSDPTAFGVGMRHSF